MRVRSSSELQPRVLRGAFLVSSSLSMADAEPQAPEATKTGCSETIELFNGKDLTGWEGHEKNWSVVDGVIETFPKGEKLATVK